MVQVSRLVGSLTGDSGRSQDRGAAAESQKTFSVLPPVLSFLSTICLHSVPFFFIHTPNIVVFTFIHPTCKTPSMSFYSL